MKKFFTLVLALILTLTCVAFADGIDWSSMTDEEINAEIAAAQAELKSRNQESAPSPTLPTPTYPTLQKGSKGGDVMTLQSRLVELNYLSGSVDGAFGDKTVAAVKLFQSTAGLNATGIADPETLTALYADDAPRARIYQALDYTAISRDPDRYEGNLYKFDGKVLQVMEQSGFGGSTYVVMRVATKGNYDNVVYVTYTRPAGASRILEDDRVTIQGVSTGLYTYETVMGSELTIPSIKAESVVVK